MNLLFVVILGGWQLVVFLVLVVLVLLILLLYVLARKTVVTVPSISLAIEKEQYDHGEIVNVTGVVKSDYDKPAQGETVVLKLTDSTDKTIDVGSAVTDAEGKYAASFAVPSDVAPGGVTVTAEDANLGVTATRTFTLARATPQTEKKGIIPNRM
jgi:uncharacterized protein (DUF58 family)